MKIRSLSFSPEALSETEHPMLGSGRSHRIFAQTLDEIEMQSQQNYLLLHHLNFNYQLIRMRLFTTNWCISHIIMAAFLVSGIAGLKESEVGENDWALKNIGEIDDLVFFNSAGQRRNRVFFSNKQIGIFGHLGKKTGSLESREKVNENQVMIENSEKMLVLWTSKKQIVKFDKSSLARSVDNRLINNPKIGPSVNSYLRIPSPSTLTYVSDSQTIFELNDKQNEVKEIPIPTDSSSLKIFAVGETIFSLTYSEPSQKVCVNELSSLGGGLIEKQCTPVKEEVSLLSFKQFDKKILVFLNNGVNLSYDVEKMSSTTFAPSASLVQVFTSAMAVKMSDGEVYSFKSDSIEKVSKSQILVEHNHNDKNVNIFAEETSGFLTLFEQESSNSMTKSKFALIQLPSEARDIRKDILRIWVNYLNPQQNQIEVIVQYSKDLRIVCYEVSKTASTNAANVLWERQQSLAYVDRILFMKYEGFADHLNNEYHIKMDKYLIEGRSVFDVIGEAPANILLRVTTEIQDLIRFLGELRSEIFNIFGQGMQASSISQSFSQHSLMKATMSSEKEKKYGLQKYMIVFTKKGTVCSIDTKSSEIKWKKLTLNFVDEDFELASLIKLKEEYEKEVAIAVFYSSQKKKSVFYAISENGDFSILKTFEGIDSKPAVFKISHHTVHLISDKKVHQFDINEKLLDPSTTKAYSFYSIEDNSRIVGWKNIDNSLVETWSLTLPSSEVLIKTDCVYRGQGEANLLIANDKRVLFKNVDFSNIAILTTEEKILENSESKTYHRVHLYLLNGKTGSIQFHEFQSYLNPSLPINLAYDEHNALVSYYSSRNRVYEIWTVEAFQLPLESELLSKPYSPFHQKEDIVFRSKVYGTTLPIKGLIISESKEALLRRNVLIITQENKIYSVQREFLSTRRPKSADPEQISAESEFDIEFIKTKYPVQEYILPINPQGYLTHSLTLFNLNSIRFSSTDFESTIFIFASGLDCFLMRLAPDKAFDMLASGFNYIQLVVIMVAVAVLAIFFRGKVREAKLRKAHLE